MVKADELFCPVCGKRTVVDAGIAEVKAGSSTQRKEGYDEEFIGRKFMCVICCESFVKEND